MKILFLLNHLNPGGITSYCYILCKNLLKNNHRDLFIASGGGQMSHEFEKLGVKLYEIPINTSSELNPKLYGAIQQLKKIIHQERIDLIHSQTRVAQWVSYHATRSTEVKNTFTCHGFLKRRLGRILFPLWPDRIIAISDAVSRHLAFDWRVSKQKIDTIFHGVEIKYDQSNKNVIGNTLRSKHNISDSDCVLGCLGRISPVKGFDRMLSVVQFIKEKKQNFRFVIIGDGPDKSMIQNRIKKEKVENFVTIVDNAANAQDYLCMMDILCVPSRQEGLGFSVLEGMACALPVVASKVGGIVDLIEHGQTGYLVEAKDFDLNFSKTILDLMSDSGKRKAIGKSALDAVTKKFSIPQMLELTEQSYSRSISNEI